MVEVNDDVILKVLHFTYDIYVLHILYLQFGNLPMSPCNPI
uniref:Transcriptional corepressor LEUNIG-like isoform X1 n=1 Tax=Rhizophora mucronata TaxID=61149 RepID=A0A2P2LFT1_RHIMU